MRNYPCMGWECIVVGGGAAGLSAALVLGRARRRTLLIDAGEQSNLVSHGVGGLLGHDGRAPAELYAIGRRELSAYPSVEIRDGQVVRGATRRRWLRARARRRSPGPCPTGAAGHRHAILPAGSARARRAVGKVGVPMPVLPRLGDAGQAARFPALPGEEAVHAALMLRGWSDDVVLFTDGAPELDAEEHRLLEAAKITIDTRRVVELIGHDGQLTAIAFADGSRLERDGLLVEAPLRQHSRLAEQLGASCTPGPLATDAIGVDSLHRTSVPAVFAAGDVCTEQPYVAGAIATGSQAAMIIVQSLLADEFGMPYPPTGSGDD